MFSDQDLVNYGFAGDVKIDGKSPQWEQLQPASIDVHLGNDFLICRNDGTNPDAVIDFKQDNSHLFTPLHVPDGEYLTMDRNTFVLATTREHLAISNRVVAEISGKSSVARLGVLIHATAGWIDPSWSGQVTLEMACLAPFPTRVYPGCPIGQLTFALLTTPSVSGYTGKYTGQVGPTASRYHLNWSATEDRWL